ncbi:MAG: hypothetical protein KDK91_33770, partial [Gammaproteobacteria bacterium]|nr:hypothetical protein [Gammaproteobacteria bacterium]
MALLLSNEEVESLLSAADCVSAMELAYAELDAGRTLAGPRADILSPIPSPGGTPEVSSGTDADTAYMLKCMSTTF